MVNSIGAALVGVSRKSTEEATEIKIGDFKIDKTNIFTTYTQLGQIDIIADPLEKAALEMSSGLEIYTENERIKEEVKTLNDEWKLDVELEAVANTLLRELLEKGTVVVYCPEGDLNTFEVLPMSYVTLLPKDAQKGQNPAYMVRGKVEKIYVNESSTDQAIKEQELALGDVILIRYNYRTHLFTDIKSRKTYGLYGRSILDKIEWRVEYYFDLLESYRKYIARYGFGRLVINPEIIAELIRDGKYKEAKTVLADIKAAQKEIKENEDILAVGTTVQPIYTQTSALDIIAIKESLERDIYSLLFGTGTSSGKEEGTTYASAKVADVNRLRLLESYRQKIKGPLEDIVQREAGNRGIRNVEDIHIQFAPLDKPVYTTQDLRNLVEAMILTTDEARVETGHPPLELDEV